MLTVTIGHMCNVHALMVEECSVIVHDKSMIVFKQLTGIGHNYSWVILCRLHRCYTIIIKIQLTELLYI